MKRILGKAARLLDDYVSENFQVGELTDYRGWWPEDVEGEADRYAHLCVTVLEPARKILGCPMRGISGARPLGFNDKGRASSMHLPPRQRATPRLRFEGTAPMLRGAALDFIPGMPCDEAFRLLDAAQRNGRLPSGGLFWYQATRFHPGPASGRFIHIDYRRTGLARERALQPPK